jgi:hypothetical protein
MMNRQAFKIRLAAISIQIHGRGAAKSQQKLLH